MLGQRRRRLLLPTALVAIATLTAGTALAAPAAGKPAAPAAVDLAAAAPQAAAPTAADDLTRWVNPFVGTQNFGNTFPGASAPFGMVQVSPDTGGQGGYDYQQDEIYGFSQTHLSGVGCGVVGELPVMPTTGAVDTVDYRQYGSKYSHDDESATPGYYSVGLADYGIKAELTATDRTGWQRYTFPAGKQANVLFSTGKANMTVLDSEITVVGDRTIEGRIRDGNFCAGKDQHTVYFTAQFDKPFASFGTWTGNTITAGSRDAAGKGGNNVNNGAYVTFPDGTSNATVKIALSYTGLAGARKNLQAETKDGFDFDATRAVLAGRWNTELGKARITGGTDERRTAYYTALYHAMLHPNLAGDVDGNYLGWDGKVHKATDFTPRQNFSLWDTYRPQNQLLEVLAPDVARDSYLSILAIGEQGGWLPRWALVNSETNIMTGDPVTPFLVEGWSKGFLAGNEERAYQLMRRNATELPPPDSQYNGRSGQEYYARLGYIPYGLSMGKPGTADCVSHGGDNDCDHPASATLEYSAADASLALMAKALGHKDDAAMFTQRGQWYRNLWDSRIEQFRPRAEDGSWMTPYDPVAAAEQFHEGGAYQYRWLVPQDPAGLVGLLGGKSGTIDALDEFFAYDDLLADPEGTARNEWIAGPYDYYAKHTYNPNNEPDLLSPYMYAWAGEPSKIATVVRAAFTLFTTGPDGMTGNDDLGTMSAWYVFSSWGIYPTMSGANFFVLSSPQFPKTEITVGDANSGAAAQGGKLTITADGVTDDNRYVQQVSVNGKATSKSWVSWDALRRGGSLDYTVGTQPSTWGTGPADAPPSVNSRPVQVPTSLSMTVSPSPVLLPTGTRSTTLTAALVGQTQGSLPVTLTATAPSGWTVKPAKATEVLRSKGLPASADVPFTLGIPAGAAAGEYQVTVTASAPGAKTVTRTVTVTLAPAPQCATTGSNCAVDLTAAYNHDGVATVAASTEGNFDGVGWSFDAALMPTPGVGELAGKTYTFPQTAGTAKNFVEARGQTLLLPAGKHASMAVLGAAHNGTQRTELTVQYTDGTAGAVPLTMTDWASGNPASGNTLALNMPHRIKAGQGQDGPPVQLYAAELKLDPTKTVQSVQLPNQTNLELYAITLS